MQTSIVIRPEETADLTAVYQINLTAFGRPAEANLVNQIRSRGVFITSLVAEQAGRVVGHILFTPMQPAAGHASVKIAGLGPVAVLPAMQKQGIGVQLVLAGLDVCRQSGYQACIVLGHPSYYPRFGFAPASRFDLKCAYDVPNDAFMALELVPGSLQNISGVLHYQPEFDGV